MNKYQVTITFDMDEEFMSFVPAHRLYISSLFTKKVIDYYSVSMETQRCWIVMNAFTKKEVEQYLTKSPLMRYWTWEVDELFVYDSQQYRLPELALN
jgi:hypothetical protein